MSHDDEIVGQAPDQASISTPGRGLAATNGHIPSKTRPPKRSVSQIKRPDRYHQHQAQHGHSTAPAILTARSECHSQTVGDALDNALMESTIGLYKTELINHLRQDAWTRLAEVEPETAGWVHWFNHTRIHLSIGKMAPARYEQARTAAA
jgi:transposase InsO family protein